MSFYGLTLVSNIAGSSLVDPSTTFYLFDRVVNIRQAFFSHQINILKNKQCCVNIFNSAVDGFNINISLSSPKLEELPVGKSLKQLNCT
jgi:hypothetical protein